MSKKENKAQAIDNLLKIYNKKRQWLAILLGLTYKDFEKMLSDGKVTYKQLRELFSTAGITMTINIQGEPETFKNDKQLAFLRNNYLIHQNSPGSWREATKNRNAPDIYWQKDDISMDELLRLEKNFNFTLLFTFTGLGSTPDTVKTYPMKTNGFNWKTVSPEIENRYKEKFQAIVTKVEEAVKPINIEDEEINDAPKKQPVKAVQYTHHEPVYNAPQKSRPDSDKENVGLRINKQQYNFISKIAKENGITASTYIGNVLAQPDILDNIKPKATTFDKENIKKITTVLPKKSNDILEEKAIEANVTKTALVYYILIRHINIIKDTRKEKSDVIDSNDAIQPVTPTVPAASTAPAEKTPASQPQAASSKTENKQPQPEKTDTPKEQSKTFRSWLRQLPTEMTSVFYREVDRARKQKLLNAPYGSQTINALKTFSYPHDEALIILSNELRKAANDLQLPKVNEDEYPYEDNMTIHHNKTLCLQYQLMKDVTGWLSATYSSDYVDLSKSKQPLTVVVDGKPLQVLRLSVRRESDNHDAVLTVTARKKTLISSKNVNVPVVPETFSTEQWYKIAISTKENWTYNNGKHLNTITNGSLDKIKEMEAKLSDALNSSIREIILETKEQRFLNDFAYMDKDGNTMWSDPDVQSGEAIFRQVKDTQEDIIKVNSMGNDAKKELLTAMVGHINAWSQRLAAK